MIFFSNKARPYHLGPYPLERIARDPAIRDFESSLPKSVTPPNEKPATEGVGEAVETYHKIFQQ